MAPSSQGSEPPGKPGRFSWLLKWGLGDDRQLYWLRPLRSRGSRGPSDV